MPPGLKITRKVSNHLIKYVKRVTIEYNPFDIRTTSARELLRQLQSNRFSQSNPKLQVNSTVSASLEPPKVEIEFVNGEKVRDTS